MNGLEYRFIFVYNSVMTTIADTPIGWRESAKKIRRDDKYRALFIEYIPNLTFYGDGYTCLNNIINTNGFCASVEVIIQSRCSSFDTFSNYFKGVIKLSQIDVDVEKCTIKCNVEDDALTELLKQREDIPVKLNKTQTMNGSTLANSNPIKTISMHSSSAVGVYVARKGYFLLDAFRVVLAYISDNRITFLSDYLTTSVSNRATKTIVFTNPAADLIGVGNIVITYTNYFNQIITVTTAKTGTVAGTLTAIVNNLNLDTRVGALPINRYYTQDYRYFPLSTSNGTTTISLYTDLPFVINTITGAAVQATSTGTTGTPSDGLSKCTIMSGSQLRNETITPFIPEVSFLECFEELNKYSNIGMELTNNGSSITLRVEPISYFLTKSNTMTLSNVRDLKYNMSKEFNNDLIKTGMDRTDVTQPTTGQMTDKISWSAYNCTSKKVDAVNKWCADFDCIDFQKTGSVGNNDEKTYIIQCITSTQGTDAETLIAQNRIYTDLVGTFIDIYVLNTHLTNYWKVEKWKYNLIGSVALGTYNIINIKVQPIVREYEFDYQLNSSQREQLITSKFQFVSFNDGGTTPNTKLGWISEITLNNETAKCKFKLLTS